VHLIEITSTPAVAGDRNTAGGRPILAEGQDWPVCGCGQRMVLFFQLDIPADVPVFGGEHLLAFQCPAHNDACFSPDARQLPPRYWQQPPPPNELAFWRFLRQRDGVAVATDDPFLRPLRLNVRRGKGGRAVKVGGRPSWQQGPESYRCACGADLAFLAHVPENFAFPKRPEAPEQLDSFSADDYGLFLGNDVYLLACPASCDPAAVWPVNQH
jgi:hypothetical protein